EKSLQTAIQALDLFTASLRTGGFVRAGPQYEQLHAVLAEQRMWALTHKRAELDPLWRKVAQNAREMHDILAPLLRAMEGMRDLDRMQPVSVVDVTPPSPLKPKKKPAKKAAGRRASAKDEPVRDHRDEEEP
ncbi:MAG TPA: hypothetical protein VM582_08775, partial [Candidatus Thermoplasmatota archaeon]|nr:hypothetical protein [Candidatus Thermoplasmatota archaeon]